MVTTQWAWGFQNYQSALDVRRRVFVEEQGFSAALEQDAHDATALHLLVLVNAVPAGAGRLYFSKGYHIGRVCVLPEFRGKRLGDLLMRMLLARAFNDGADYVDIGAQRQAAGFYEKLNFQQNGPEYTEEGVFHLPMRITREDFMRLLEDTPCQHRKPNNI